MNLYLFRHEQQTGPYTEAAARTLVATGEIERTCPAWKEGMAEWTPLEQVLDLSTPPTRPPSPLAPPPVPVRAPLGRVVPDASTVQPTPPMKLGTKINVYGAQVLSVVVGVLILLRFLASCHHF